MPQRIQDAARTRNETRQVQGLADNLDLRMGERGGAFACESLRIYGSARTCPTSWPIAASQPGISSSTFSSHSAGQLWWWSAILLRFNWIFFVGQKQQQTRQQQQQRQHDKHNKGQTAGVAGGQQDIRGCPPPFRKVAMKAIMKWNSLTKGSQLLFLLPFVAVAVANVLQLCRLASSRRSCPFVLPFAGAVVRPHQII